jgi:hypothetical protein
MRSSRRAVVLGLRWLDTALDFPHRRALSPSKAPSSRSTPGHPRFHKTSWVTVGLGRSPTFRAFASSREISEGWPTYLRETLTAVYKINGC